MPERPALVNPACKKAMTIAANAEIGATHQKKQPPANSVPSCAYSKKRRKSSSQGHRSSDIAGWHARLQRRHCPGYLRQHAVLQIGLPMPLRRILN